jgi:electron transport complex protein RnfB
MSKQQLFEQINAALPQTQCTQCGHSGCAPYARAIAFDAEPINQCPPGGAAGIRTLAQLTNQPVTKLNPINGIEQDRQIAYIIEADCIGCTKCIQACPVDAIIGAAKLMHTVLDDLCTGCGLCVAPCPVDCIDMPLANERGQSLDWSDTQAQRARELYETRNLRLTREKEEIAQQRRQKLQHKHHELMQSDNDDDAHKRDIVAAALARARARRG